jgi:hypothetical protein
MTPTSDKWEKNIAKAMSQADHSSESKDVSSGITLPNWFPLAVCAVFGFMLAKLVTFGNEVHPANEGRDYAMGTRVALLMVAEDVESYFETYGELPDYSPSPIASVMNVTYERYSGDHFKLTMPSGDDTLTFDGTAKTLSLD